MGVWARVENQTMADAMVLLSQCFSFLDFFLTLSDMVNWKYQVMGFSNVIQISSYVKGKGKFKEVYVVRGHGKS